MYVVHSNLFQDLDIAVGVMPPDDAMELSTTCGVHPPPHMQGLMTTGVFRGRETQIVAQAHWSVNRERDWLYSERLKATGIFEITDNLRMGRRKILII